MGKLLDNQKTNIRFQYDNIILYYPTDEQINKIKEIINKNIDNDYVSVDCIKFILDKLTNLDEDFENINNDELEMLLNNGKRNIQLLIREITSMLNEIRDDILYFNIENIKKTNSLLNILIYNSEQKKMNEKLNKLLKKHKINIDTSKIDTTNPNTLVKLVEDFSKELNNK